MQNNQLGRSMVEMLGVLAIIGVLSVGAIAGYQKAMMKYKINGFTNAYSQLIGSLSHYAENLAKANDGTAQDISSMVYKLNLIPDGMYYKSSKVYDKYFNNRLIILNGNRNMGIDIKIADDLKVSYRTEICKILFANIAIPLHDSIVNAWIYKGAGNPAGTIWHGDKYCAQNNKCLKDMTLNDVEQLCNECIKDSECNVSIPIFSLD